jgi:hypothetical protein
MGCLVASGFDFRINVANGCYVIYADPIRVTCWIIEEIISGTSHHY